MKIERQSLRTIDKRPFEIPLFCEPEGLTRSRTWSALSQWQVYEACRRDRENMRRRAAPHTLTTCFIYGPDGHGAHIWCQHTKHDALILCLWMP